MFFSDERFPYMFFVISLRRSIVMLGFASVRHTKL